MVRLGARINGLRECAAMTPDDWPARTVAFLLAGTVAWRLNKDGALGSRLGVSRRLVANQAALARVYEERYMDFVRVATAVTGSEAVGVDAVQEAFARALANLGAYRGEAPLAGWVWRIVVNSALDARGREGEGSDGPSAAESAANGHSSDEIGVRRWVSLLPERQRLAVFLRYYADLDYASIASALEIEVGTVSATLSAAHTSLRQMLREVPL